MCVCVCVDGWVRVRYWEGGGAIRIVDGANQQLSHGLGCSVATGQLAFKKEGSWGVCANEGGAASPPEHSEPDQSRGFTPPSRTVVLRGDGDWTARHTRMRFADPSGLDAAVSRAAPHNDAAETRLAARGAGGAVLRTLRPPTCAAEKIPFFTDSSSAIHTTTRNTRRRLRRPGNGGSYAQLRLPDGKCQFHGICSRQ